MTSESGSSGGGSSGGSGAPSFATQSDALRRQRENTAPTYPNESLVAGGGGGPSPLPYSAAPLGASLGTATSKNSVYESIIGGSGARSLETGGAGGDGGKTPVGTTVNQTPAANTEGPESTNISSAPRSDFSVVLAGQTGNRPNRSAARSNNFVSLVGGAGGLGRKTDAAKRTLIGGA